MAEKKKSPLRPLIGLLVMVLVGIGALVGGVAGGKASAVPKLALDLEGGTQVILTPRLVEGSEDSGALDQAAINEAINIIRQRIDASGVAEAEISTLGADNIVVAIPGQADEATLDLIRTSATMEFRPVLINGAPDPLTVAQSGATQSGASPVGPQSGAPAAIDEAGALAEADADGNGQLADQPGSAPENNSDLLWITEQAHYDFLTLDCTDPAAVVRHEAADPTKPLVACGADGSGKYILGPVDIEGHHIDGADSGMTYSQAGQPTGTIGVNIRFDSEGTEQFAEVSQRLFDLKDSDPTRNRFAVVLDGSVISAPSMNQPIANGQAQITGSFTTESGKALANQLSFGSLPLNFEVQSESQLSATLGANHLQMGIYAGLVGLILVVLWLFWQYRGLALVATGSLVLAAGITYLSIALLSWAIGYRLSLPGVVGLIVAVGITADSFIVYFERIRDEVRDGVALKGAVDRGWVRARRTIVISDVVNLVAASVLYLLAVGGVQGFAFTLGLTTLVDLLVIFLFTHPVMQLLMETKFFGSGSKWSGLDPEHLGAASRSTYVGRGRVREGRGRGISPAKHHSSESELDQGESPGSRPSEAGLAETLSRPQSPETPAGDGDPSGKDASATAAGVGGSAAGGISIAERRRLAKRAAAQAEGSTQA